MADGITMGYRAYLELDYQSPMMVKSTFLLGRAMQNIGNDDVTNDFDTNNVIFEPGIGWILDSDGFDWGNLANLTATQPFWYTDSNTTKASGFLFSYTQHTQTLTDVSYTGIASEGAPGWQKQVENDGSWDLQLAADESAYPKPNSSEDHTDMDRVLVVQETHYPKDCVVYSLYIPGHIKQTSGALATLYFSGPPGWTDGFNGKGEYALKLFGSGRARLYETDGTNWKLRDQFQWAMSNAIFGFSYTIYVMSNGRQHTNGDWSGNKIVIKSVGMFAKEKSMGQTETLVFSLTALASQLITSKYPAHVYNVPGNTRTGHPVSGRVRIDLRRDVRAHVGLAKLKYKTSGTLYDGLFTVPFVVTADSPVMYVEWYAIRPSGTTIDVKLYTEDGVECTGTAVIDDTYGGQKYFELVEGVSSYRLKILYTSDSNSTPVLTELRYIQDGEYVDYPGLPTIIPEERTSELELLSTEIQNTNITGKTNDPTQEGFSIVVNDLDGGIKDLMNRSGMPVTLKVDIGEEYDVKLFQGFIEQNSGMLIGRDPNKDYGGINFWRYQLTASGEWRRLSEQLSPRRFTWFSQEQTKPFTITRIVRTLLGAAGYPDSMIDVQELPIRLFATSDNEYVMEPGTPIAPFLIDLITKYLGAYLIFDENAGAYGMWRLTFRKKPPYNNLAKFFLSRPTGNKVPHLSSSYGTSTSGDQTILHTFMRQGTISKWTEPPEGNVVLCVGGSGLGGNLAQSTGSAVSYKQLALNTRSYNFLKLPDTDPNYPDPTHPDFLGRIVPIEIYDVSLTTQAAVNWMCRRVFEFSCFARTYWSFQAPLLFVTDTTDSIVTTRRPLRFYDPVLIETSIGVFEQFIITSCNPQYHKDHLMWANYEVCRPSNIDEYAAV